MSRYVASIIQRDGVARYLVRGKLTDSQEKATHYPHPSAASAAIRAFRRYLSRRNYAQSDYADQIIDTRDPERVVNEEWLEAEAAKAPA